MVTTEAIFPLEYVRKESCIYLIIILPNVKVLCTDFFQGILEADCHRYIERVEMYRKSYCVDQLNICI